MTALVIQQLEAALAQLEGDGFGSIAAAAADLRHAKEGVAHSEAHLDGLRLRREHTAKALEILRAES